MYKLSINGQRPTDIDEYHEKGELIKVRFPIMTDAVINVSAEGINGIFETGDGWQYYCFEMPDHDVDVAVGYESYMANKNYFSPLMSPGISMFDYQTTVNNNAPKKASFCPECGTPKDPDQEYCPACSERLELQKIIDFSKSE